MRFISQTGWNDFRRYDYTAQVRCDGSTESRLGVRDITRLGRMYYSSNHVTAVCGQ